MSELGDGTDVYKLYAVVVHVDILNASFFGHYICYVKDFRGTWFRTDDDKVRIADLEEVLSQGAYMLLYSRMSARPSSLLTTEPSKEENQTAEMAQEVAPCPHQPLESTAKCDNLSSISGLLPPSDLHVKVSSCEEVDSDVLLRETVEYMDVDNSDCGSLYLKRIEVDGDPNCTMEEFASVDHALRADPRSVSSEKITSSGGEHLTRELPSPSTSKQDCRLAKGVSLCCSTEKLAPNQVLVLENGKTSHDVPVAPSSSSENDAPVKNLPFLPLKKVKSGEISLMPGVGIEDEVENFGDNNLFSGVKLKPIFTPGFLARHQRNRLVKKNGNATVGHGSCVSGLLPPSDENLEVCRRGVNFEEQREIPQCTNVNNPESCSGLVSLGKIASPGGQDMICEPVSVSIEDPVGASGGRNLSSGKNLKPLFFPGFLANRPPKTNIKRRVSAAVDHDTCAPVLNVSNCNGFAKPSCNHQKSDETEWQEVHSDCRQNEMVDVNLVNSAAKEHQKICSDCNMNEMFDVDFVKSTILCNGDANGSKCDSLCGSSDENLTLKGASPLEAAATNNYLTRVGNCEMAADFESEDGTHWKTD